MRPPPLLLLPLLLLLSSCGAATPPADTPFQLPAPRNLKVHLYNAQQALSWEPVSLNNDARPVVYQVQYKYSTSSTWYDVNRKDSRVDCTNLTGTECNFTANSLSEGFPPHFNITLRLRAKLGDLVSAWVEAPWFEHYRNATIGPPEDIWVTPEEGSLIISFSSPFDVPASVAFFWYYVYYWEKGGSKQYLKDPAQPILDALDKDSSPKDDAWDSVSIVSFPENKQEDILQNTLNQSTDPSHQPVEGGP
ncbi:interferon gamma receptor 2 isoform X2 [Orcinus orca]|uniref:interferon gamma receptor 2 isoform X2 n=1 Tax=Orcinus orca TaxID=9733 RepID=UPI00144160EE|nr:interferon gamma receptor 2 isoform X2 [Orcinus orca]